MTDWPAYLTGLVAVLVLSAVASREGVREQLWRTSGTLALVWALGRLYVTNTGNYDPWEFNLFLDGAAMIAVLWHPAGKGQALVGWLFLAQLVCHASYGVREMLMWSNDIVFYYDVLTWIAWAQLLSVGVWCGGIWLQNRLPRFWSFRNPVGRVPPYRTGGEKL